MMMRTGSSSQDGRDGRAVDGLVMGWWMVDGWLNFGPKGGVKLFGGIFFGLGFRCLFGMVVKLWVCDCFGRKKEARLQL